MLHVRAAAVKWTVASRVCRIILISCWAAPQQSHLPCLWSDSNPPKALNPPTGCGGRYPQIIFTLHPVKPECQLINAHFLCLTIDSVFIGQFHKLPDQKEASGPTHCSLSFPPLLSALFSKGFLISLSARQVLLQLVFLHSGSHTNEDDRVIICCQSQVSVIRAYV